MDEMSVTWGFVCAFTEGRYPPYMMKQGNPPTPEKTYLIGYVYNSLFHIVGYGKTWQEARKMAYQDHSVKFHQDAHD
jgi:hypothetical protein